MPSRINYKFRQPRKTCAALSAYWLQLMQEGDACQVRFKKLTAYASGGAVAKQGAYEIACYQGGSTHQGALRTAYTPLGGKGMQVRAPTRHHAFDEGAMAELVQYIDKNHGSGVLFTFSYTAQFFGTRQDHTVGFFKDGRMAYLFDADRGEFCGEPTIDVVDHNIFKMYLDHRASAFGECHYVHYRHPHP